MSNFIDTIFTNNLSKLEALIESGYSVNFKIPNTDGCTPLHIAVGFDKQEGKASLLSYLLRKGADPNARSLDGLTPVHIASIWNNCFELEILLQNGGNPWLTDNENKNAFDMAADNNAHEAYMLLNLYLAENKFNYKEEEKFLHNDAKLKMNSLPFDNLKVSQIRSETSFYESTNHNFVTANELPPLILDSSIDESENSLHSITKLLKKKDKINFSIKTYNNNNELKDLHFKALAKSSLTNSMQSIQESQMSFDIFNKAFIKTPNESEIIDELNQNNISKICDINNSLDKFYDSQKSQDTLNAAFITTPTPTNSEISNTSLFKYASQDNENIIDSDVENGIILIEQQTKYSNGDFTSNSNSLSSFDNDWKMFQTALDITLTSSSCSTHSLPAMLNNDLKKLSNSEIFEKLKELGDNPGPIIECTRNVYLQRLSKLQAGCGINCILPKPKYCPELYLFLEGQLHMSRLKKLDQTLSDDFDKSSPFTKWREGNQRCSFNYFLLDPRVTKNLPLRSHNLPLQEKFLTFINSLFYVGKGSRNRPYDHLFEAAKAKSQKDQNEKVAHILDIWNSGLGVISLHCFNNSFPAEAYTREACIIEAIGLSNLTNIKRGNFYGISKKWTISKKRQIGISLIYRAMEIFLLEGERLIRPKDIFSVC